MLEIKNIASYESFNLKLPMKIETGGLFRKSIEYTTEIEVKVIRREDKTVDLIIGDPRFVNE